MGALDGVKVVEATLLVQGPQAGLTLSDMGADVIKVELPGIGDQARWIPIDGANDTRGPYYISGNRGKRSVTIDLRTPGGRDAFLAIADTCDVFLSNFKPGTLDEWGLSYEEMSERNPRLIYGTGSTFGTKGPGAQREGADLAGQASGGLIMSTGVDDGDPTPVGVTIADHIGCQNLTAGVLAALYSREQTGRGQRVDVSLFGGQIYAQAAEYTYYFLSGKLPGRSNQGHPLLHAAYGIVPTADGWLAIVGVPAHLREAFYEAIERPDILADPRFAADYFDPETRKALFALFRESFPKRTTADWCARLDAAGCRYAPVQTYAQVAEDPHAWDNGYLIEVEHPEWGKTTTVGTPIMMSDTPLTPGEIAPELGQHTEEVLLEHGLSWDDIAALNEAGAI